MILMPDSIKLIKASFNKTGGADNDHPSTHEINSDSNQEFIDQ